MDNSKLIEKIEHLCESKNEKPNKTFTNSGVGKDFIYNLSKGSQPSLTKIAKLANYFDVPLDYFSEIDKKNKPSAEAKSLSDIENEILKIFHTLPEDKKQAFMTVARSLKSQPKDK